MKTIRRSFSLACALLVFLTASVTGFAAQGGAGEEVYTKTEEYGNGFTYFDTVYDNDTYGREEGHYVTVMPGTAVHAITLACDTIYGGMTLSRVTDYAEQQGWNVLGGLNSDFFSTRYGIPLGIVVEDGQYKSSPEGFASFCIAENGTASILDYTAVQITLTNRGGASGSQNAGKTTQLTHFNKHREDGAGMYLFDENFSTVDTHTSSNGWYVRFRIKEGTMKTSGSMTLEVAEVLESVYPLDIGEGCMVLTADSTSGMREEYEKFAVGDTVTLTTHTWGSDTLANCRWACGGGDVLIRDGEITSQSGWDSAIAGKNPRSAAGIRADGTMVFYTLDGRQSGYSGGVTLAQLAAELKALGCVDAVNLDGGGSTVISMQEPGDTEPTLQNRPSNGSEASCASYILFVADELASGIAGHLFLENNGLILYQGDSVTLRPLATDGAYEPVSVPDDVTVEKTGGLGILDGWTYTAPWTSAEARFALRSESTGAEGSGGITVINSINSMTVKVRGSESKNLVLKRGESVPMSCSAAYYDMPVVIDQDSFDYLISDGLGSVTTDGTILVSDRAAGKGTVTVLCGGQASTLNITIAGAFPDTQGHWADYYIQDLLDQGVVNGMPDGTFAPDAKIRRGDFMLMMYRAAGSPLVSGSMPFSDVKSGAYYASAVKWAAQQGIALGTGSGKFSPESTVTREQSFAFVSRYLSRKGLVYDYDFSVLEAFSDRSRIAGYASKPAATLVGLGIINGSGGKIDPKGYLTRGQMAKILSVALEKEN